MEITSQNFLAHWGESKLLIIVYGRGSEIYPHDSQEWQIIVECKDNRLLLT